MGRPSARLALPLRSETILDECPEKPPATWHRKTAPSHCCPRPSSPTNASILMHTIVNHVTWIVHHSPAAEHPANATTMVLEVASRLLSLRRVFVISTKSLDKDLKDSRPNADQILTALVSSLGGQSLFRSSLSFQCLSVPVSRQLLLLPGLLETKKFSTRRQG